MIYLSTLLLTLLVTIILVPVTIKVAEMIEKYDMPGRRKVHVRPIPRTGGIAMAVAVFGSMMLWAQENPFLSAYIISAGIIIFFGLIDDFIDLPYYFKFAAQFLAAVIIIFFGNVEIRSLGALLPGHHLLGPWISIPLTIIIIVGVTNAINLADGLDGLAGGICVLSFSCTGYLAYLSGNPAICLLAVALIGSIFGFLKYNTHPASIFMGDTGSQFLGFSLVTVTLSLTQGNAALSPVLPLIIFGFPVLDTTVVMLERIGAGRSPFQADRNHFHHKLINLGFRHAEAVLAIYLMQATLVLSAAIFRNYSEWFLLISYGIFVDFVVIGFFTAEITRWKVPRSLLANRKIRDKLAIIEKKGIWIVYCMRTIEYFIPGLFFITIFLPASIPGYVAAAAGGLLSLTVIFSFVGKKWLKWVLLADLYIIVPPIMFFSTGDLRVPLSPAMLWTYRFLFVALIVFVIATLKLTRRMNGFKVTPLSFLIVFLAIVAPYLSGLYSEYRDLMLIITKIVIFFFSYEVLIGELRGEYRRLVFFTLSSFIVIIIRFLL